LIRVGRDRIEFALQAEHGSLGGTKSSVFGKPIPTCTEDCAAGVATAQGSSNQFLSRRIFPREFVKAERMWTSTVQRQIIPSSLLTSN
jgi:hypothetical protein